MTQENVAGGAFLTQRPAWRAPRKVREESGSGGLWSPRRRVVVVGGEGQPRCKSRLSSGRRASTRPPAMSRSRCETDNLRSAEHRGKSRKDARKIGLASQDYALFQTLQSAAKSQSTRFHCGRATSPLAGLKFAEPASGESSAHRAPYMICE